MYRGHELLQVARHITMYGGTSSDDKFLMIRFDKPAWRKLHRTSVKFIDVDPWTISRFHDTLNRKYPSVEAYTRVLEKILLGDIEPKMRLRKFTFSDEVGIKQMASNIYLYTLPKRV